MNFFCYMNSRVLEFQLPYTKAVIFKTPLQLTIKEKKPDTDRHSNAQRTLNKIGSTLNETFAG